jgi:hypothetical protein
MLEIQQELNRKVRQLEKLVAEIRELITGEAADVPAAKTTHSDVGGQQSKRFAGMSTGNAIRQYLVQKGKPATKHEIMEALAFGGAHMGKYPRRTIANGVAFAAAAGHLKIEQDEFRGDNDLVTLCKK